jgi:hypothetical protein
MLVNEKIWWCQDTRCNDKIFITVCTKIKSLEVDFHFFVLPSINLQIATRIHLAILYGKMKLHFYSIRLIILHIQQRKGAPRTKQLTNHRVKWNIIYFTKHNFYKTGPQKTPIIMEHCVNMFLLTYAIFIIVFHIFYVSFSYALF